MTTTATPPLEPAAEWTNKRGRAPGCNGLAGQMGLIAGDARLGVLTVDGEDVGITPGGEASTSLTAEDQHTLLQLRAENAGRDQMGNELSGLLI